MSRPVRGAWIETVTAYDSHNWGCSRAPCGARGLKLAAHEHHDGAEPSRPVRGAWIETKTASSKIGWGYRRAPCGARGLKPELRNQID